MNAKLKSALQYIGMTALTVALLWLSLKGIPDVEGENKAGFIWKAWLRSDKFYLLMVALVAMASHLLRAYRWKILLVPTGNNVKLSSSFLSVMIGYLVNLAIPRGGEISRCYNLLKLEQTPVETSFGTVVAERIVDVLCLIAIIIISFFVEWDRLMAFIGTLPISLSGGGFMTLVIIAIIGLGGLGFVIYFFRNNKKLKKILSGFKEGLLAVFKLDQSWIFITLSILIWVLYFVMSYFVIIAFPETETLAFSAVLTLFAMGAIAMAAPLPGGAGSYHTIVPLGLVMLYNLPAGDAIAFVFIFHAWQTFILILAGVVSLIISYWIVKWKK